MQIEVTKFRFFILLGVIVVLGGIISAYALTAGQAPPNGHTINEIAPPANCDSGQVLTWDGNSWSCSSIDSSFSKNSSYSLLNTESVTTNISNPHAACFISSINNGGCDSGFSCSASYTGGKWVITSRNSGDCNRGATCVVTCLS